MLGLAERGEVRVNHRHAGTVMAQVDLELTQVLARFQQMRGVRMAQRLDMRGLLHAAGLEGEAKGALQSRTIQRFSGRGRALAGAAFGGEEQARMAMGLPLFAQEFERALGQRDVTILVALAGADVEKQALRINVADLQLEAFAQTQPAGVDRSQGDAMIEGGHVAEDAAHLGSGENDRQFELRVGAGEGHLGGPGPAEGLLPKELDRAQRLGGRLPGDLLDRLEMEKVLAELLGADLIG